MSSYIREVLFINGDDGNAMTNGYCVGKYLGEK